MKEARTYSEWRLMLARPHSGAENMARDTALMDRARETGQSVFTVYSWSVPTLSLGRNQAARGRYDADALRRHGIDVVRRPTGGRALLHDREVTYSVTAPSFDHESLRASYARINRILLEGLSRLGVDASEARLEERTPQLGDLPCFAAPVVGELVTEGAKLVGSAQLRENGALLQHGSILIDDDQRVISDLLEGAGPKIVSPAPATLHRSLGRVPSIAEVASALFDAVRSLEDESALPLAEVELREATSRYLERYESKLWTWRK